VKPIQPEPMLRMLQSILTWSEPVYLLRRLQRARLSLALSLRVELLEMDRARRAIKAERKITEEQAAGLRRQIQSLRIVEGTLLGAPEETRRLFQNRIRALEEVWARQRSRMVQNGADQQAMVGLARGIVQKQRRIRELERSI
jgi:hypothetical protein